MLEMIYSKMGKFIKLIGIHLLILFLLVGCKSSQQENTDPNVIRVGVISGPEAVIMEQARMIAQHQYGLDIDIITFSDYNMPNTALAEGSIDANMFQHQPYLDAAVKAHDYDLVSVDKTFIYPVGIYSKFHKSMADIPTHSIIAIPNDPSNEARALLLLQQAGLIKLRTANPLTTTTQDIVSNYKNLIFKELDAAQLPRALNDVAAAVINTNYAMAAGLLPSRDAIFIETKDSPYANIIVVKRENRDDPRVKKLIEALHSPKVEKKAEEIFKGQAVPAWK